MVGPMHMQLVACQFITLPLWYGVVKLILGVPVPVTAPSLMAERHAPGAPLLSGFGGDGPGGAQVFRDGSPETAGG